MEWTKCCKWMWAFCMAVLLAGCGPDDSYRGYLLSGRWFGDLGMMVYGEPAIGSDLEFVPYDYGGGTQGYGYETDYYYGWHGRVEMVEHYFTWMVRNGIIYLRFDNPDLDCNIRDYSLSADYFEGYMDGVYSSTWFTLRNYDRYWYDYGYFSSYYYRTRGIADTVEAKGEEACRAVPKCERKVNMRERPDTVLSVQ